MSNEAQRALKYAQILGNVKELANTIGAYVYGATNNTRLIQLHDAFIEQLSKADPATLTKILDDLELVISKNQLLYGLDFYAVAHNGTGPINYYRALNDVTPTADDYSLTYTLKYMDKLLPDILRVGDDVTARIQANSTGKQRTSQVAYAAGPYTFPDLAAIEALIVNYKSGYEHFKRRATIARAAMPAPAPRRRTTAPAPARVYEDVPDVYRRRTGAGGVTGWTTRKPVPEPAPAAPAPQPKTKKARNKQRLTALFSAFPEWGFSDVRNKPTALAESVDAYARRIVPIYLRVVSGDNQDARETAQALMQAPAITVASDMTPWVSVAETIAEEINTYAIDRHVARGFGEVLQLMSAFQRKKRVTPEYTQILTEILNDTNREIMRLLSQSPTITDDAREKLRQATLRETVKIAIGLDLEDVDLDPFTADMSPSISKSTSTSHAVVGKYAPIEAVNCCLDLVFGKQQRRKRDVRKSALYAVLVQENAAHSTAPDNNLETVPVIEKEQDLMQAFRQISPAVPPGNNKSHRDMLLQEINRIVCGGYASLLARKRSIDGWPPVPNADDKRVTTFQKMFAVYGITYGDLHEEMQTIYDNNDKALQKEFYDGTATYISRRVLVLAQICTEVAEELSMSSTAEAQALGKQLQSTLRNSLKNLENVGIVARYVPQAPDAGAVSPDTDET